MSEYWKYSKLVLHGAFSRFSWGRDLVVAFAINCASLFPAPIFRIEETTASHTIAKSQEPVALSVRRARCSSARFDPLI